MKTRELLFNKLGTNYDSSVFINERGACGAATISIGKQKLSFTHTDDSYSVCYPTIYSTYFNNTIHTQK